LLWILLSYMLLLMLIKITECDRLAKIVIQNQLLLPLLSDDNLPGWSRFYSARNIKRIAAAAALLLEQPASDPQSHLAAQSASSCDWVNFRALPLSPRSPEGA
jgi:hypothetical protein